MNTVYLVDDDDNYRELVQLTLQDDCGVECVHGFARARDLLRHLDGHPPEGSELVLADLHMPEMSGLELVQSIRQLHALPVVILTGAASDTERQACLDAGAVEFLPKPLAYPDLVAMLQDLVRTVRAAHP